MAFLDPNAPIVAREFRTADPPNARWELSSFSSNRFLGWPADNPNNPQPGMLQIDSQLSLGKYTYDTRLSAPWSPVVPQASAQNPLLRLFVSEGGLNTGAELVADDVTLRENNGLKYVSVNATRILASEPIVINQPGISPATPETWHAPVLLGNWAQNGSFAPGYRLDVAGRVQLRGQVKEPVASSATIFNLPAGYRPTVAMSWAIKANADAGTIGQVEMRPNGDLVIIANTAALRVQSVLDAISFPTQ